MKNVKAIIDCQYYCASEPGARLKPKGGYQFSIFVDSDEFMYCKDEMMAVAEQLIAKHNNDMQKFEIVDCHLVWVDPQPLEGFAEAWAAYEEQMYEQHCEQDRQQEDMDAWAGTF